MKPTKKAKANKLLSTFIRELANEAVIRTPGVGISGDRMITRAEALAKTMWEIALGYEEEIINAKGETVKKTHGADKGMITIIADRMEGRVSTTDAKDKSRKASVAERVGEQYRDRLNAAAKEAGRDITGGKTKAKTKGTVSKRS